MCRALPLLRSLPLAAMLAVCANPLHAGSSQPATQPAGKPKVVVVPIQGPLYYQMMIPEVSKIIRGATALKPEAVVLVISSPGGNRTTAFGIAEQIAGLPTRNVVAYVSGENGGVFGEAVFPLLACSRVFMAPENTIGLTAPADLNNHADQA
jgi:membrane-bound ClpP family serine protease